MAEDRKTGELITIQPVSNSMESTNISGVPFGIQLNDTNFKVWSKMMEVHAAGLGKHGYLTGKISVVEEDSPGYTKWVTEDAIVLGWLLKTKEPYLLSLFIDLPTAKDIWESATQMFYDGSDESQYYELRCKATWTRQDGRPVNLYFTELKGVWQDLDKRRSIKMVCAADLRTRKEEFSKDRVYDFLAGLDNGFDQVRSEILRIKPIPGIEKCFSLVQREAQRKTTMLGTKATTASPFMAMVTKSPSPSMRPPPTGTPRPTRTQEDIDKDKLHCNHCNGKRHTEATCFELHGYPEWYWELKKQLKAKGKRTGQAKQAESGDEGAAMIAGHIGSNCNVGKVALATKYSGPRPYTSAHGLEKQMGHNMEEKLYHAAKEGTNLMLSLIEQISDEDQGNISIALIASIKRDSGWIINFGATDHMTYDKSLFHHMTFPPKENVITTNGEVAPVTGAGSIDLTQSLSLHNTLLDIQTRAIIGRGTKRRGLYYVEDVAPGRVNQVRSSYNNKTKTIWLWHRRLGHASFGYLKKLLPSLFSGISESDFRCNDCILAKSHRTSYHLSFNKRTVPFELVHSDVWGPSPIVTQQSLRWFVIFVDDCTRMTWLYTMKQKSDVGPIFQQFYHMIGNQFSFPIKVLISDNGG
ncbi:hypothetical protein ACFXTN_026308 [Malus domestica]